MVQFIINDANVEDMVSSTKNMFSTEYPWICWTPCASPDIGLLLRKIHKDPFMYDTIKVANLIVFYIHKQKLNFSLRIVHKKKDCIASNFLLLMSLLKVKSEFQALKGSVLILSNDWLKQLNWNQL